MNIKDILFDLKETYKRYKEPQHIWFAASDVNETGRYVQVICQFIYSEALEGYRFHVSFKYPGISDVCHVYTDFIDDEVSFIKACIGLINDIIGQYPELQNATQDYLSRY